ncbi:MAG TPA: phosphate ABC transporter substrate-binding/OmpA family protein, partial [Planctomycetota bacterium]|nr:phosphate ABC transporter substrate-binding/OmpA family protein [Planctomycetota bacterium]
MTTPSRRGAGLTGLGVFISFLLVVGLIALGAYVLMKPETTPASGSGANAGATPTAATHQAASSPAIGPAITQLIEPLTAIPHLEAAAPYTPKNGVIEIDISEYAGYSGLIVANGGLEPNPESIFTKQFGVSVKLSLSEGENWSQLNNGKFAASATTVDVLAVMGRQFNVTVPVQIGFSRGADGVVVTSNIKKVNDLAGKILVASQFNEAEFFIRYLAQEAGLDVVVMSDLSVAPPKDRIGLVFCEDAFIAGDVFFKELSQPKPRLAGCVSWAPKTFEIIDQSQGKARMLVSNKNLLVVADILVVNKGFAEANPKAVQGLVAGLMTANQLLRDDPKPYLATIAKAFTTKDSPWTAEKAKEELARVHLSNLPENLAFFGGTIDAAGSFGSIYQSSLLAYGPIMQNPVDAERFIEMSALKAAEATGQFATQKIAIAPIKSGSASAIEGSPLLSKDIRFLFQPNSSNLAADSPENQKYLDTIKGYLQVSPGSMVLLRGHVDNSLVSQFRDQGGEALVRSMALKAVELSKARAASVRKALIERAKIDPKRIETVGRGWEEPSGGEAEKNRR